MMGGSLYISLSSGWSWIKCHLLIKMFLMFGKAGWYVVTKCSIFFRTSLFFCKADSRSVNLTSEVIFFYEIVKVISSAKAFFEVVDVPIEGFSWRVSSQKSKGFALYETFSDPVRVTGREMRVLKSLCRFKMCADVKDSLVVKSLAFVNSCIQKVNLFIRYFSRKFNWRVMPVCKSNEFIYLLSLSSPQRENIVNVSFPLKRFSFTEVQYFCLDRRRKDVGKGDCHLCTHGKALQEIGVHYTVGLCVSARLLRSLLYYLLPYACQLG